MRPTYPLTKSQAPTCQGQQNGTLISNDFINYIYIIYICAMLVSRLGNLYKVKIHILWWDRHEQICLMSVLAYAHFPLPQPSLCINPSLCFNHKPTSNPKLHFLNLKSQDFSSLCFFIYFLMFLFKTPSPRTTFIYG